MQKQANWSALANICSGIKPIMVCNFLVEKPAAQEPLAKKPILWQKLLPKPSL
jgi:hypothetical protein